MEMITIPAGEVTLSDRRTERSWTVGIASFLLAPVPVTASETSRFPRVDVSWLDAIRFCNALSEREGLTPAYEVDEDVKWDVAANGFRLPSEAEWEHACRAGTTGPRYGPLDEVAWYRENSAESVHEVGGKAPNAWGLHDMLGNVWEWCWDVYDAEVYGEYRVLRGGGWFDEHWSCRASVRRRSHPTFRVDDVGFRLARTL
ncbi:formylglycine-generating enzyme family protein [Amycolatopsis pittospori]|uniref:formylglycine-generating enzyme family protein n=1 Tax=Amycolatopsis pittospori TaxID=2749434 RepID=UPI0015F08DD4|nr:SUMF1/EgtB/PvdO family nonheme iron enzyme [Amycolatopsis pittospori]